MPIRISGSTGISGLDGSATTPVLQGASANASGIYYSGNTVFVSTSGTTALTIGPTGNVALTNNNFSIAGQYISPYSGMMKNRIINGDFRIDQRFNGAANNNTGAGNYVVDRWYHYSWGAAGAGKLRFQQNNTNGPGSLATQTATGFSNYFGANVVSANTVNAGDYWFFSQPIEGFNTSDLAWGTANASPVTLSFWSYSSIPGTHGGTVTAMGDNTCFPFTYTINTANTWQYQTITIPGPTTGGTGTWYANNNIGINIYFSLGVGSNYNRSNTFTWGVTQQQWATGTVNVVSAANGAFYLTGVQLEKGSQATAFEFRHYTTELQLSQRYYQAYTDVVLVMTGTGYNTSSGLQSPFSLNTPMRVAPTVIISGGNNGGAPSTLSANFIGTRHITWLVNPTSAATNMYYQWYFAASSELGPQN